MQRLGFGLSRGWTVLLLIIGLLLATAFWIGPLRPLPAELELVVTQRDDVVDVLAVSGELTAQRTVRFAVPLAVRNVGARSARPRAVLLSVSARYHLSTARGRLRGEVTAGVPLRRYRVNLPIYPVEPGLPAVPLPGLDTIWLEPDLPAWYCVLRDGIPEFMPAPQLDAASLADVRIFYSFNTARSSERHSGLINVRVEPALIRTQPAPQPPTFRIVFDAPGAPLPALGQLRHAGTRTAHCGDPEQPVELYTVTSATQPGGRFHAIYVDGTARKHLYDLNGDGVIDLETWDGDGDGRFEARREARYAVPEFVTPLPPRDPSMTQPDTVPPAATFLDLFHAVADGPWRFGERLREDSAAAAADRVAATASRAAMAARANAAARADRSVEDVAQPDSAWLDLFNNVAAGPFRFSERPPAAMPADAAQRAADVAPPVADMGPAAAPPGSDTLAATADTAAADTASAAESAPRRRAVPIGTPVRRDTIPR